MATESSTPSRLPRTYGRRLRARRQNYQRLLSGSNRIGPTRFTTNRELTQSSRQKSPVTPAPPAAAGRLTEIVTMAGNSRALAP